MTDRMEGIPPGPRMDPPEAAGGMTSRWVWPALIIVITAAALIPVLQNGFVNWDDTPMVADNPNYRGFSADHLTWMWTTFHMGHYQPLAWMTLALDHAVWGMNPFGYHLTNLILHVANALLVYGLAMILMSPPGSAPDWRMRASGAAAALFFAVHPMRVEVVAWVTERREVLAAFFFLLTVYAHLRGWRALTVAACLLSLTAKATAIVMPAVLLVLDVYPLKRLSVSPRTWSSPPAVRAWAEKIPFVALSIVFGLLAIHAQESAGALRSVEQHGLSSRAAQTALGLVFYIWKTVLPFGLSPIYELGPDVRLTAATFLMCASLVIAVTAVLIRLSRRRPVFLAAWAIYVVILSPVLGVAQSGPQLVADRYSYLSCIGFAVLIGAGLRRWLDRSVHLPAVLCVAILAGLGALTWTQAKIWKNSRTLWTHATTLNPSSYFANYNLAQAYLSDKQQDSAVMQFRQMTERWPMDARAHEGLGSAQFEGGDLGAALASIRRAIELDSAFVPARVQLGLVYMRGARPDLAAPEFEAAITLKPDHVAARVHLGKALVAMNRVDEAIAQYARAIEIRPDFAPAHNSLANELAIKGRMDDAILHYEQALRLDPNLHQAHNNLGSALVQLGRIDEAIEHFRECLRHDPSYAKAHYNLALALSRLGRYDESLAEFDAALQSAPASGTLRQSILRDIKRVKEHP